MKSIIVTYIPHTFMHNFASAEPFFFYLSSIQFEVHATHFEVMKLVVILQVVILLVVILLVVNPKVDM